jgi:cell filamentation protein
MDPYVYPGTTVLKNLRGIRDAELLKEFEMDMTTRRVEMLNVRPTRGKFDTAHLAAIHKHIFQDVFAWAGQFRTVRIARPGEFYFAFPELVRPCLEDTFEKLAREQHLESLPAQAFCARAAYFMGELNAIHPFRDGNGRTQREFIRQLALRNGFRIRWSAVTRDQMGHASKLSFRAGDNSGLEKLLATALGLPSTDTGPIY